MEIEIKGIESLGEKVERAKELIDELTRITFELKAEIRPHAVITTPKDKE